MALCAGCHNTSQHNTGIVLKETASAGAAGGHSDSGMVAGGYSGTYSDDCDYDDMAGAGAGAGASGGADASGSSDRKFVVDARFGKLTYW